jgi:hypothetical protein
MSVKDKHLASCKKESEARRARKNLEQELDVIMKEVRIHGIVGITRILEFTRRNIHITGQRIKASCGSSTPLSATIM